MKPSSKVAVSQGAFRAAAAFFVPLLLGMLLFSASANAITRATVLARAQTWVDHPVPYSQSAYHLGYRTDCSGYVSMCWAAGTSYCTATFHEVTSSIRVSQLKPGDAMLKPNYHIRLFYGWVDVAHTQYVAYEAASTIVAGVRIHSIASDLAFGFVPTRYAFITDGLPPANILRNGSFSVWTSGASLPLWWNVEGSEGGYAWSSNASVQHPTSGSVRLVNSSADTSSSAEISQLTSITPGATYRVSAQAMSPSYPSATDLRVTYLDATGNSLGRFDRTGRAIVSASRYGSISMTTVAPTGTVDAQVSLRLAGGSTAPDGSSVPRAGTFVTVDGISLTRPQSSCTIKENAASLGNNSSLVLSGAAAPPSTSGKWITVMELQPGNRSWNILVKVPIRSTGTWRYSTVCHRSRRRGIYRFKAVIHAAPEYLGYTSRTIAAILH